MQQVEESWFSMDSHDSGVDRGEASVKKELPEVSKQLLKDAIRDILGESINLAKEGDTTRESLTREMLSLIEQLIDEKSDLIFKQMDTKGLTLQDLVLVRQWAEVATGKNAIFRGGLKSELRFTDGSPAVQNWRDLPGIIRMFKKVTSIREDIKSLRIGLKEDMGFHSENISMPSEEKVAKFLVEIIEAISKKLNVKAAKN